MSLTSAMNIGRTALSASQLGVQVTGNNLANAATPGYSRQIISLSPSRGIRAGSIYLGRGVQVDAVRRQVDAALEARLRTGISNEARAGVDVQLLSNVEALLNELTDSDLSSELTAFFGRWSDLANSPEDHGARSMVVQQGRALAGHMRSLRQQLEGTRNLIDEQLGATVAHADGLLSQISRVNQEIANAEAGTAVANSLRDQRDTLMAELSGLMEVTAVEQPSGAINVLLGSTPLVTGGRSRGLEIEYRQNADTTELLVRTKLDPQGVAIEEGQIGGLLANRTSLVDDTIDRLDAVASQLIFEVNRAHTVGYPSSRLTSVRSTQQISAADRARAFNDPLNESLASLPFQMSNGSVLVTVTNTATGASRTTRVDVDLDGLTDAGTPGFADDTSLDDFANALDEVANVSVTTNPDGTLSISTSPGYELGFSDDSSGALAVLGINTYFTGTDAGNIDVRDALQADPSLIAAGLAHGGSRVDNGTALAINGLQDVRLAALSNASVKESWLDAVQSIAVRTGTAASKAEAAMLVRENLEAQRAAVSGVGMDEEAMNLLTFQRQYEGAARFISVVNEMTQELVGLL